MALYFLKRQQDVSPHANVFKVSRPDVQSILKQSKHLFDKLPTLRAMTFFYHKAILKYKQ